MLSFTFSFENINIVVPGPKSSLWIAASVADAAQDTKTLSSKGESIFFIGGEPVSI